MTTDPFDALREPLRPVRPDPAFAARLRERLEALVLDPTLEVTMNDTDTAVRLRPGDLSYTSLWTRDVAAAERFYTAVLGWRTAGDHGGLGRQVTNLRTGMGMFGGQEPTLFFCALVDDVDASAQRVRAAGGTVGDRQEMPYGTLLDCRDDQGLAFALHQHPPGDGPSVAADTGGPGELAYVAIQVPDTDRARAFYGSVLGWEFVAGSEPGNWHVEIGGAPTRPSMIGLGLHPDTAPTVVPMFSTTDVHAACEAVRAAGGTASEPESAGYGVAAECIDDQGGRFHLAQF